MRRMNIDTVFRLKLQYKPGQLARVAQAVAEEYGLLGEIKTIRLGLDHTIRDVTVETADDEQTKRIEDRIKNLSGVEILNTRDQVFVMHKGGKIHSTSTVPLNDLSDLRQAYTPGVSRVALAIKENPNLAYEYTSLSRSVGIFTNGTRVLGLGDIGHLASLPVMEGKAVLYDKFVGLSATPILVNTKDPKEFVETVLRIAPSFGAIHLEDIRSPDCFFIESELEKSLNKPVMHDDQHGTAIVALSAIINACKITKIPLEYAKVGQIGLGAAGAAIARLLLSYGVKRVFVTDQNKNAVSWLERLGATYSPLDSLLMDSDIIIAATGCTNLISPTQIRKGQIIFALSNPNAEIDPQIAISAGAVFASDGRSINNALAFPGVFKGALKCRATKISTKMKIAAAIAIAEMTEEGEVVPDPLNSNVHEHVANKVIMAAKEEGLAQSLEQ